MFNPKTILKSIPSFWRDRFEDIGILETLYSFMGVAAGDYYGDCLSRLSSLSLEYTPVSKQASWTPIYLSDLSRLHIPSTGASNTSSLTIYGVGGDRSVINSCSRIYGVPEVSTAYLTIGNDYEFFYSDSPEIKDLIKLTGRRGFLTRFSRYVVFYNNDPMYFFDSQEPTKPIASYPLTLRLLSSLLTEQGWEDAIDSEIEIEYQGIVATSSIYSVVDDSGYKFVLLDPETFSSSIDNSTVKITGLLSEPVTTTIHENYLIPTRQIFLWGFDCSLDDLELFKRWGYLVKSGFYNDVPVRSTEQYKSILLLLQEAKLLGLSAPRLANLSNLLTNSSITIYDDISDTVRQVDLVGGRVVTSLTSYNLVKGLAIESRIAQQSQSWNTTFGVVYKENCHLINFLDSSTYRLLTTLWASNPPSNFRITTTADILLANLIAPITDSMAILEKAPGWDPNYSSAVRLYYTSTSYIVLPSGSYEFKVIASNTIPKYTSINPSIEAVDYNSGISSWLNNGLVLPQDLWEEESDQRRLVSTNKYDFIIGEMPLHRVGDYRLKIPTSDRQGSYFDAISSENPDGSAWLTSYKLTKDLLLNKIVLTSSINLMASPRESLLSELISDTLDQSKRHIAVLSRDLVEYIPTPQDSLDIAIVAPDLQELTSAVTYGGIGSLGYTLLLGNAALTAKPTTVTVIDPVTSANIATQVIGWVTGKVLLDLGAGSASLNNVSPLSCVVDGVQLSCSVDLATNFVGAPSPLMVVGASYPEYTAHYDFSSNTVGEWLQPELIP